METVWIYTFNEKAQPTEAFTTLALLKRDLPAYILTRISSGYYDIESKFGDRIGTVKKLPLIIQ